MSSKTIVALEAMTVNLELLDAAARRRDLHLIVLAGVPGMYLPGGRDVDIQQCDTFDLDAVRARLEEHGDSLVGLLSPTDTWGIQAVALCEELGLPHLTSSERLEKLRDKAWVRHTTDAAFGKVRTGIDQSPHILKPRKGTGSQNIELFPTRLELEESAEKRNLVSDEWVVEPYFRGPVYSAETYTRGGSTALLGVTNRIMSPEPLFVELVKTFPHLHGTSWEGSVEAWAKTILESVEFEAGFAHIEFCETANGFELIEINARMAGALIGPAIHQTTGIDIYDILIADALGEEPCSLVRNIRGGHSHVSVYAETAGTLTSIDGLDLLDGLPGNIGWIPAKAVGAEISHVGDYKSRIGNIYATAAEPGLAQDYAVSASRHLRVTVSGD
ncbi:ATP-grasp domain-containing protein [Arthrobacter sp. RCC_34]|uniref:ATP-grasp domain-containing protein n=1 Tax=Arthrobacter sp. RCC_34 TaxID=3239230 RepID=UPI003525C208